MKRISLLTALAALLLAAPAAHATNYIWDNNTPYGNFATSGVFPKADLFPLGAAPRNKYFIAADANIVEQAIQDIRSAWLGAKWLGYQPQSSDPTPSGLGGVGQNGYLWLSTSDGKVHLHYNGSDSAVGTAPTLQQAYSAGSAGIQTITLDSTRLGVVVKDAAGPVGGTLLGVRDNGGTKLFDVAQGGGTGGTTTLQGTTAVLGVNTSSPTGTVYIQQAAPSNGATNATTLKVIGSTSSNSLANGEAPFVWIDASRQVNFQFSGTPIAHQEAVRIDYPTYGTSAYHITNAATLRVTGAPTIDTSTVLDNTWSLFVDSGTSYLGSAAQWSDSGNATYLQLGAGQSASVSGSSVARIRYNASTDAVQISTNGGAYFDVGSSSGGGTVTGSGTSGSIPVWSSSTALTDSSLSSSSGNLTLATGKTFAVGSNTLISSDQLAAQYLLIGSQAAGDILTASSSTAWTRLGVSGTAGTFLRSTGSAVGYSTLVLPNSATSGDLFYGSSSNTMGSLAVSSTAGTFVRSTGSAPAYSTLVLPNSATAGDITYATSTNTLGSLAVSSTAGTFLRSTGSAPAYSTLVLPNAATTGDLPYASASNTVSMLGAGTSGYVLTSNGAGTAPSWQAVSGGAGAVTGTGSSGTIPLWTSTTGLGDSSFTQSSGNVSLASGKNLSSAGGASNLDWSGSSGTFDTGTGAVTLRGNVAFPSSSTKTFDLSNSSGLMKTTTGALTVGASSSTFTNVIYADGAIDRSSGAVLTVGGANSTDLAFKAGNVEQGRFQNNSGAASQLLLGVTSPTSQGSSFSSQLNSILELSTGTGAISADTPYPVLALSKNQTGTAQKIIGVVAFVNQGAVSTQRQNVTLIGETDGNVSSGKLVINTNNAGTAATGFSLDSSQRANFPTSLRVGSSGVATYLLDVNGSVNADQVVMLKNTANAGYSGIVLLNDSGTGKGAMGWGNSGVGITGLRNNFLIYTEGGIKFVGASATTDLGSTDSSGNWTFAGKVGVGVAAGTTPTFGLDVIRSTSGDGVTMWKNTSSSGYSTVSIYNNSGTQKGAIGWGNASVGLTAQQNNMFIYTEGGFNIVGAGATTHMLDMTSAGVTTFYGAIGNSGNINFNWTGSGTFGTPSGTNTFNGNISVPTGKTLTVGSNVLFGTVTDKLRGEMVAFSSGAVGDLHYADTTTTLARLAQPADKTFVLGSGGTSTAPSWVKRPQVGWSATDYALNGTGTTTGSGDFTEGVAFQLLRPSTITGVRFYYPDNTSRSIKFSCWDSGGTVQATKTSTIATAGDTTVTFNTPWSVGASETYKKLTCAHYNSSTYWSLIAKASLSGVPTAPFEAGPNMVWVDLGVYAAGDANPTNSDSVVVDMEPVFTTP